MDGLEEDFQTYRLERMDNKYKRIGYHVAAIHQEFTSGLKLDHLTEEEVELLTIFQERYSDLMTILVVKKHRLTIEKNKREKVQTQIKNGYYNKSVLRKSHHLNLVCK